MKRLCHIPVFVDDGWPPGQCLRAAGHKGRCDIYDDSVDFDPTPQGPAMFNGVDVTLLADPGDEDDYRKKHPFCCVRTCNEDAVCEVQPCWGFQPVVLGLYCEKHARELGLLR